MQACDASSGCSGPGPAACNKCANGYTTNTTTNACEGNKVTYESRVKYCTQTRFIPDDNECKLLSQACPLGKFCTNTAGSFNCSGLSKYQCYAITHIANSCFVSLVVMAMLLDCDASCHESSGCKASGATGCLKCKEGYQRVKKRGCQDIDECKRPGACTNGLDCKNTAGSFQCVCDKPKELVDGVCVRPPPSSAPSPAESKPESKKKHTNAESKPESKKKHTKNVEVEDDESDDDDDDNNKSDKKEATSTKAKDEL